jgi:hypothetical protein
MKHKLLLLTYFFSLSLVHAQWTQVEGPNDGNFYALDRDSIYLYGMAKHGIYLSADEGLTWNFVGPSLPGVAYDIATCDFFQVERGVIYTSDSNNRGYFSANFGETWHPILNPVNSLDNSVCWPFIKEDTMFQKRGTRAYRSIDRGATWTTCNGTIPNEVFRFFWCQGEYFAWGGRYIYRSSDGGFSWLEAYAASTYFSMVDAVGDTIYAINNEFVNPQKQILKSGDGFRSWVSFDINTVPIFQTFGSFSFLTGDNNQVNYFTNFYGTYGDPCFSQMASTQDGGIHWKKNNTYSYFRFRIKDIETYPTHSIIATNYNLLKASENAEVLTEIDTRAPSEVIRKIDFYQDTLLVSTGGFPHKKGPADPDWIRLSSNHYFPNCRNEIYASATQKRIAIHDQAGSFIQYSADGGVNWGLYYTEHPQGVAVTNNIIVFPQRYNIYTLKDADAGLNYRTNPFVTPYFGGHIAFKTGFISISAQPKNYVSDENLNLLYWMDPFPCASPGSSNAGGLVITDGISTYNFCNELAFVFELDDPKWDTIYPTDFIAGIPMRQNGIKGGLLEEGVIWLRTGKGLYYSIDEGHYFFPLYPQPPEPDITAFAIKDGVGWVGTAKGNIYYLKLPILRKVSPPNLDLDFKLFPNPSVGHLWIKSTDNLSETFEVKLVDLSGKVLMVREFTPGKTWELELPSLPMGLYFLNFNTLEKTFTKKIVIRK